MKNLTNDCNFSNFKMIKESNFTMLNTSCRIFRVDVWLFFDVGLLYSFNYLIFVLAKQVSFCIKFDFDSCWKLMLLLAVCFVLQSELLLECLLQCYSEMLLGKTEVFADLYYEEVFLADLEYWEELPADLVYSEVFFVDLEYIALVYLADLECAVCQLYLVLIADLECTDGCNADFCKH